MHNDIHTKLPLYTGDTGYQARPRLSRGLRIVLASALSLAAFQYLRLYSDLLSAPENVQVPLRAPEWLDKCHLLNAKPGPPPDFNTRTQSDRFAPGTKPTLITVSTYVDLAFKTLLISSCCLQNATIWTGGVNGLEVLHGDILLDGGIIKRVGVIESDVLAHYSHLTRIDAKGKWASPG